MIEIKNRLLKNILRKTRTSFIDWETILSRATYNLNARVIQYLSAFSASILLRVFSNISMLNLIAQNLDHASVHVCMTNVLDFITHKIIVYEFLSFRTQLHDIIKIRSDQRKNEKTKRFNKDIIHYEFFIDDYVLLYQKDSDKLKSRWRESFKIDEYEETHDIFYTLRQLNDKRIKKTFHDNHLKIFIFRIEHLFDSSDISFSKYQTIRKSKHKKKRSKKLFTSHLSWHISSQLTHLISIDTFHLN